MPRAETLRIMYGTLTGLQRMDTKNDNTNMVYCTNSSVQRIIPKQEHEENMQQNTTSLM